MVAIFSFMVVLMARLMMVSNDSNNNYDLSFLNIAKKGYLGIKAKYNDIWRYDIVNGSWFWQWGNYGESNFSGNAPSPTIFSSSSSLTGHRLWLYGGFSDKGMFVVFLLHILTGTYFVAEFKTTSAMHIFDYSDPFSINWESKMFRYDTIYPENYNYSQTTVPSRPGSSSYSLFETNGTVRLFSAYEEDFYGT